MKRRIQKRRATTRRSQMSKDDQHKDSGNDARQELPGQPDHEKADAPAAADPRYQRRQAAVPEVAGVGSSLSSYAEKMVDALAAKLDDAYHRAKSAAQGVDVDLGYGAKHETVYTKDETGYGAKDTGYGARYDQGDEAYEDLAVNAAPGTGELFVTVDRVCTGGNPESVAGAIVTVTGPGFMDSQPTSAKGEVTFSKLPAGHYCVGATIPGSGPLPPGKVIAKLAKATNTDDPVPIDPGETTRVAFATDDHAVNIEGLAYARINTPKGTTRQGLTGINLEIYRGGKRVTTATTLAQGYFKSDQAVCPGTITIQAPETVTTAKGIFHRTHSGPAAVNVPSGATASPPPVFFEYVAAPAALLLFACKTDHQHGHMKQEPLPRTTFQIWAGSPVTGKLIREVHQTGVTPVRADGFIAGNYSIVAIPEKGSGLIPVDSDAIHITLADGDVFDASDRFCFQHCRHTAVFRVVDNCGLPVPNVPVTLTSQSKAAAPIQLYTDSDGEARFAPLDPGKYTAFPAGTFRYKGTDLVPEPANAARQFTVGETTHMQHHAFEEFKLVEDIHKVIGELRFPDGSPVPVTLIDIFDDQNNLVATTATDAHGRFAQVLQTAGTFKLRPRSPLGTAVQEITAVVNSVTNTGITTYTGGGGSGSGGGRPGQFPQGRQVAESVIDLSAYPVLTEEVGYPPSPLAGGISGGGTSGSALGALATTALRDVLGWKVKGDDPKGFLGALTQSFSLRDVEGHIESKWTPRTYAVMSDLAGGVTGAQASIYTRAKDAIDEALPLLDGLYALRDDADDEDVTALKAIIQNHMHELVSELGISGGPRLVRVDQIFSLLLDDVPQTFAQLQARIETEPDRVGGELGTLRNEMGLWSVTPVAPATQVLVNTVDEEQDVTNYRILVDYLTSLRQNWVNSRQFFGRTTTTPFFGTQLVLISRQLSVIAESVGEVRFAMGSVFIGPSERQTIELVFPANVPNGQLPRRPPLRPSALPPDPAKPAILPLNDTTIDSDPLLVEELLEWIHNFASEEGPRLVQDGGKYAVNRSVLPVVVKLRNLVIGAINPTNINDLPKGYRTQRVLRAWQELATQLDELAFLANPITHTIPSQV